MANTNLRCPPVTLCQQDGSYTAPFSNSDVLVVSPAWSSQVVGMVSTWVDPNMPSDVQDDSERAFTSQFNWALHLSLQAIIIPLPMQHSFPYNYARLIAASVQGLSGMNIWVRVPACSHDVEDPWELWNKVRTMCEYSPRLCIALEIDADLPSSPLLARWWGEPVKAVLLSLTAFSTNARGYPTLTKPHQAFLSECFLKGVQVVLVNGGDSSLLPAPSTIADEFPSLNMSETEDSPAQHQHPLRGHWEYLSYMFRRIPELSPEDQLEAPYRDYLQSPLQPLQDNLESATYEVFEKDHVKYTHYEEAVYHALKSLNSSTVTVLMVVGAGRGPLVSASLRASQRAGCPLHLYAIEKNPNALINIQCRAAEECWPEDSVRIVHADMRHWNAPEKADILVSELLGSFGDNELSPECLDGAQRFLAPGGISIPSSYTSYIQPVTTHTLWNEVRSRDDLKHFETPFVVKPHRYTPLAPPQQVFTFHHPNLAQRIDNTRSIALSFPYVLDSISLQGQHAVCQGFIGYFTTTLFGDVTLSTHPDHHTPGMHSWFPIYFPIRNPCMVCPELPIDLVMWRRHSSTKVWYEWALTSPSISQVHNPNGRSYTVGL